MRNSCKHFAEPFFDDIFSEPKEPTEEQIKKYKLYQCGECHRWFPFLGVTLSGEKGNGKWPNKQH